MYRARGNKLHSIQLVCYGLQPLNQFKAFSCTRSTAQKDSLIANQQRIRIKAQGQSLICRKLSARTDQGNSF